MYFLNYKNITCYVIFYINIKENKMKRALASKKVLLKTMAFCQRHLMRVYPAYYRLDSSNFGPQKVWNAGVQMVALNTQTYGKHQAFNVPLIKPSSHVSHFLCLSANLIAPWSLLYIPGSHLLQLTSIVLLED